MKIQKTETNARRFMNAVTASLFTALLAGAMILFAPEAGFSQGNEPKPAKTTNTETKAVPAQGSVDLAGTVNAAPAGGTQNVIVTNTEAAPVQVRDINRKLTTPVQGLAHHQTGLPQSSALLYTVPAGKRLVIEFITAEVHLESALDFRVMVSASSGSPMLLYFPLTPSPLPGSPNRFGFTGMTKIYADAGTNVRTHLWMSPPDTTYNTLTVYFTGYLEDL
jgi:hypothetical protein